LLLQQNKSPKNMVQHKKTTKVEVVDSWTINGQVVVELKHEEQGLSSGIVFQAADGSTWKLKARMLFGHITNQKKFPNETTSVCYPIFSNIEKQSRNALKILKKEATGIFQYLLETENAQLPSSGETLWVLSN